MVFGLWMRSEAKDLLCSIEILGSALRLFEDDKKEMSSSGLTRGSLLLSAIPELTKNADK